MKRLKIFLITISLITCSSLQSQIIYFCNYYQDKQKCLYDCLIKKCSPIIKKENTHFVYYFEIKDYVLDSTISICLRRICNSSEFNHVNFNGFIKCEDSNILIYKNNFSDKFIKDFKLDSINDSIKNILIDNSKPIFNGLINYCIDDLGSYCICNFEYDFKNFIRGNCMYKSSDKQ